MLLSELTRDSLLYSEVNQIVGTPDFQTIKGSPSHNFHDLAVFILMIKSICDYASSEGFDAASFSVLEGLCTEGVVDQLRNEVKYQAIVYNLYRLITLVEKQHRTIMEQNLLEGLIAGFATAAVSEAGKP